MDKKKEEYIELFINIILLAFLKIQVQNIFINYQIDFLPYKKIFIFYFIIYKDDQAYHQDDEIYLHKRLLIYQKLGLNIQKNFHQIYFLIEYLVSPIYFVYIHKDYSIVHKQFPHLLLFFSNHKRHIFFWNCKNKKYPLYPVPIKLQPSKGKFGKISIKAYFFSYGSLGI